MIDLSQVRVLNGGREPLDFPPAARLDAFGVVPGTMYLRTTGTAGWPSVAIDDSGALVQAATLWIFLQIDGSWYAAGAERLRPTQLNGTKPNAHPQYGGLSTLIGDGWFGKHDSPIRGRNPAFGEVIGVMVVAGNTRFGTDTPVRERTDVVCVEWREGAIMREVWREGSAIVPVPPPTPPPSPVDDSWKAAYLTLLRTVDTLTTRVQQLSDEVLAAREAHALDHHEGTASLEGLSARVGALEARPVPTQAVVRVSPRDVLQSREIIAALR